MRTETAGGPSGSNTGLLAVVATTCTLALAAPATAAARVTPVRSGDARVCATAKTVHRVWAGDWLGFQRAFAQGDLTQAQAHLILLEEDVTSYRARVRATRGSSARGRRLRSALLRFTTAARRSNDRFAAALEAAEDNEDTSAPFSDGGQIIAGAAARLAPAAARARCTLPPV